MFGLQYETDDILNNIGRNLILDKKAKIQEQFFYPDMEDSVVNRVYSNVVVHPATIVLLKLAALFGVAIFVYLIWSCIRCGEVRDERQKAKDNGDRFSKVNYLWAIFSHSKLDVNLNKKKINDAIVEVETLKSQYLTVSAQLDRMLKFNQFQNVIPPRIPPSYNDSIENVIEKK